MTSCHSMGSSDWQYSAREGVPSGLRNWMLWFMVAVGGVLLLRSCLLVWWNLTDLGGLGWERLLFGKTMIGVSYYVIWISWKCAGVNIEGRRSRSSN